MSHMTKAIESLLEVYRTESNERRARMTMVMIIERLIRRIENHDHPSLQYVADTETVNSVDEAGRPMNYAVVCDPLPTKTLDEVMTSLLKRC